MDELKIILPIVFLLVIIIAQNIWLAKSIADFWKSEAKIHDAELDVTKMTVERLDTQAEILMNINDSQVVIANMILQLTEIEKGKEQNAGQSRFRYDFCNEADVSVTESGSDGRKED